MRVVVAIISFALIFVAVTFLISLGLSILFKPESSHVDVLRDWRGWIAIEKWRGCLLFGEAAELSYSVGCQGTAPAR